MHFTLIAWLVIGLTFGGFAGGAEPAATERAATEQPRPPFLIGAFFRDFGRYLVAWDRVGEGDLAPDFELQPIRFYHFDGITPDDARSAASEALRGVRLSAFRGKRPVALVFGSYT